MHTDSAPQAQGLFRRGFPRESLRYDGGNKADCGRRYYNRPDPCGYSRWRKKKVTNIQDSLSRQISAFKRARISPGVPLLAVALNRVLVTAIKSDAGTPLPETSATAKQR